MQWVRAALGGCAAGGRCCTRGLRGGGAVLGPVALGELRRRGGECEGGAPWGGAGAPGGLRRGGVLRGGGGPCCAGGTVWGT